MERKGNLLFLSGYEKPWNQEIQEQDGLLEIKPSKSHDRPSAGTNQETLTKEYMNHQTLPEMSRAPQGKMAAIIV